MNTKRLYLASYSHIADDCVTMTQKYPIMLVIYQADVLCHNTNCNDALSTIILKQIYGLYYQKIDIEIQVKDNYNPTFFFFFTNACWLWNTTYKELSVIPLLIAFNKINMAFYVFKSKMYFCEIFSRENCTYKRELNNVM